MRISCHMTLHMLAWLAADCTNPVLMPQFVLQIVTLTAWSACCWLVGEWLDSLDIPLHCTMQQLSAIHSTSAVGP